MVDASTITAAATFGDHAIQWLDSEHAGTLAAWALFLFVTLILYRQTRAIEAHRKRDIAGLTERMNRCEEQHKACEEGRKNLAFALWGLLNGDTDDAKDRAKKAIDEYSGTG